MPFGRLGSDADFEKTEIFQQVPLDIRRAGGQQVIDKPVSETGFRQSFAY